ncbi:MAG: AraC family transcriptional regulator [Lachnospiraceae bacterium]
MSESLFSIFPNEVFVDLSLYQYGWQQCDPLHSYGPYARNHYLFHYVISGTGTLIANDSNGIPREFLIRSGQGFLISPKQITTYFADKDYPWEYTWIEFDGLRVKEALSISGLSIDNPIYRSLDKNLSLELKNTMLHIAKHSDETPFYLIGHCYLFLDLLTKSSASRKIMTGFKMRDFYIKESLSFIEQNFQNDITVEDIATFCNLNRSYFGKIFRDAIGKSPQEFLIRYRISKADQLLKSTDLSIGDIGNAIGYSNQLHFSRAFKTVHGISPRQWRNENKKIELGNN